MNQLPAEITLKVLDNFSKPGLKRARLISKSVNLLATEKLFRRAFASVHPKDLEVLQAISSHPIISLAVREVVYTGVFFHYPAVHYSNREDLSGAEKDAAHCYYHARFLEQEYTRKTGNDLAIITAALTNMPNVRRVLLTDHWREPIESRSPLCRDYRHRRYVPKPIGVPLLNENGLPFDYGFATMCKALALSRRQVDSFDTDYCSLTMIKAGWQAHWHCMPLATLACTPGELQYYCDAVRGVRDWTLCLESFPGQLMSFKSDNLHKLLVAAVDVETLHFHLINKTSLVISNPLGTHTWRNLRSVYLNVMHITRMELVKFFQRHCRTLQDIEMGCLVLREGTWEEAAVQLRHLNWRSLESIKCTHLKDYAYGNEHGEPNINDEEVEKCILGFEYGSLYKDIDETDEEDSYGDDSTDTDSDVMMT